MAMLIKGIMDEDFVNYKKPSMYIAFPFCTFKCDKEFGCAICQNSTLANAPDIVTAPSDIVKRYLSNPISKAIVISGLEPFDSILSLSDLIERFRRDTKDDIVIYTGYTEEELEHGDDIRSRVYEYIKEHYKNIIVKFGRYIPNQEKHYDEVLGVELASPNQYARRVS